MQAFHPDSSLLRSHGSIGPSSSFSGSLHSSFSADMPLHEVARLVGHPLRSPSAIGPNTTRPSAPAGPTRASLQLPSAGRQSPALDPQTDGLRNSRASPHATRQDSQPPSLDLRRSGSHQLAASPKSTSESLEEPPNTAMSTHTHSRSSKVRAAQHASRRQSLPAHLQPQMPAAAGHSRSSGSRALQDALHQQSTRPFEQSQPAHIPKPAPSPRASRMAAQSFADRPLTSDLEPRLQRSRRGRSSAEGSAWDPLPAPQADGEASPQPGTALAATTRMQAQAASSDLLGEHPDPEDPTGLLGMQQGGRGRRTRQPSPRGDGLADELAALMAQQSWLEDTAGQAAHSAIQGCVCISASISGGSPPHAVVDRSQKGASVVLGGALMGQCSGKLAFHMGLADIPVCISRSSQGSHPGHLGALRCRWPDVESSMH